MRDEEPGCCVHWLLKWAGNVWVCVHTVSVGPGTPSPKAAGTALAIVKFSLSALRLPFLPSLMARVDGEQIHNAWKLFLSLFTFFVPFFSR